MKCYSGKQVWGQPLSTSDFHNSLNLAMAPLPRAGGDFKVFPTTSDGSRRISKLRMWLDRIVPTLFFFSVAQGKVSIQKQKIKVTLNREKAEASFTPLPPFPHQIKHSGILRKLGH